MGTRFDINFHCAAVSVWSLGLARCTDSYVHAPQLAPRAAAAMAGFQQNSIMGAASLFSKALEGRAQIAVAKAGDQQGPAGRAQVAVAGPGQGEGLRRQQAPGCEGEPPGSARGQQCKGRPPGIRLHLLQAARHTPVCLIAPPSRTRGEKEGAFDLAPSPAATAR